MDRTQIIGAVTPYEPQPCGKCGGSGGTTETDTSDGTFRQTFRPCAACGGSGRR